MAEFEQAVTDVLQDEGGLSNNPDDPGGLTNHGISMRFLRTFGDKYDFNKNGILEDDILSLTPTQAKIIYQNEFWRSIYEKIDNQRVCNFIFYMAVNSGTANAHRIVQRGTWACDKKYYQTIQEDGVLGDKTVVAINEIGLPFLIALKAEYANFYHLIVLRNSKKQQFLKGWLRRCYES